MKQIKFLLTDTDGEREVLSEDALAACEMDEESVKAVYGNDACWYRLTLVDATFGDQQAAVREAGGDESLLPQKRFVRAVEKWEKQYAGQEEKSLLDVSESAFAQLKPPALGNAIQTAILQYWYPTASKAVDFFRQRRQSPDASEKAKS